MPIAASFGSSRRSIANAKSAVFRSCSTPARPSSRARAGRPLYGETALFLARRHKNVHLEISGIPPKRLPRYVPRLASLADKVLWGTDWPSPGVVSMRRNVEDFRALGFGEEIEQKI